MKLYRITMDGAGSRWAGSKAGATGQRINMWEASGRVGKKSDIVIDEVDVPAGKAGLIDFLNSLSA